MHHAATESLYMIRSRLRSRSRSVKYFLFGFAPAGCVPRLRGAGPHEVRYEPEPGHPAPFRMKLRSPDVPVHDRTAKRFTMVGGAGVRLAVRGNTHIRVHKV